MASDNDRDIGELKAGEDEVGLRPDSENGHRGSGRPDMDDMMGMRDRGSGGREFSPIKEMMEGSDEPNKFLVRTVISEEELNDDLVNFTELMWALYGYIDIPALHLMRYHLRVSVGGLGRQQAHDMFIGERVRRKEMFSGVLSGGSVMRRAKSINNEEVQVGDTTV